MSPKFRYTRLIAHSFTRGTSSSGTPSRRKITCAGRSRASSATRSAWPRCAKPSIAAIVSSRTCGSSAAIRRGVNALWMNPRRRVWSGGWRPDRPVACVRSASSKTACTSGGRGLNGDCVFSEENVAGSLKIAWMSS